MNNLVSHKFEISRQVRNKRNGHKSFVIWFLGLSGSGKSTLANKVEEKLFQQGINTYSLDGDNIRQGLNKNLGFSREDRHENLRRIAEVAKLFVDNGNVVIASFITPMESDRNSIKEIIGEDEFVEVFVNTSVEECERRDVKGLYKKARSGEIKNFTGIDAPFEKPVKPAIEIKTEEEAPEHAVERIMEVLQDKLKL
ncbi:adenylyl-sulfate kinase [Salegentibacter sediminis]|uniref:adenylyl-sulfate kinase n=1 Tax=Salegentibacter sediminis TaxID=1930251 RepID=UPI0009BD7B29|nr:adenylyl-sulfate kinase [Salegentibacter sediminis]